MLRPVTSASIAVLPWDAGWFGRWRADGHHQQQHRPQESTGASWAGAELQAEAGDCCESRSESGKGEARGGLGAWSSGPDEGIIPEQQ